MSSEALTVLLRHHYSGNVRELLNIVEQTVILCRNGEIGIDQLPPAVFLLCPGQEAEKPEVMAMSTQITRETLAELLALHNGNRTLIARELGVDRTTLWRWMKKNGIAA